VNCIRCAGACCEEITIEINASNEFPGAMAEWLAARGVPAGPRLYAVPSRCPQLTDAGLCRCHEEKPLVCAVMAVGGQECLDALRRRRTPEQYAAIRDEGDPEVIHDGAGRRPS
jgi:hypothetical protein